MILILFLKNNPTPRRTLRLFAGNLKNVYRRLASAFNLIVALLYFLVTVERQKQGWGEEREKEITYSTAQSPKLIWLMYKGFHLVGRIQTGADWGIYYHNRS